MTRINNRRRRRSSEIDSWVTLEEVLRNSTPLRKFYASGRPAFTADGRPVAPDIAEKAITWGLVKPLDRDLFGDAKNAQLFELKEKSK